jgi:purine-cytosine permease-like protein
MVVRKYEHPVVRRVIFFHSAAVELSLFIFCLRFSAGTLGPVAFGLGLQDSCLVILFFNMLFAIFPAYL